MGNGSIERSFKHEARHAPPTLPAATAFQNTLKIAIEEKKNGNLDKSAFLFGVALHTIQDATSPAHAGFQPWSNGESLPDQALHGLSESMGPGPYSPLWKETKKAWEAYKAGDVNGFSIKCPCAP